MEFIPIIIIAMTLWFWWDSVGAKEQARLKGRAKCMTYQVQFLDDTVAVNKIRLRRNSVGQVQLYRIFEFEFSADGIRRHHGQIEMLGRHVLKVEMGVYPELDERDEFRLH